MSFGGLWMSFFLADLGVLLEASYKLFAAVLIIGAAVCVTITAVSSHLLNKRLKKQKEEEDERKG